jgi:hypothetical protein
MEYGPRQFASFTNAMSVTAEAMLPERPSRVSAVLRNLDASITMYVGASTVDSGSFPLPAGASMTLTTIAAVYVVAASGTPTLAIWEEYN